MNKLTILFLAACFSAGSAIFAQTGEYKTVADRMEQLRTLMLNPEKTALEELAADSLSYGHSVGLIEDKAAFVDDLVKGKSVFTSVSYADQTIKISGDVAIVRHRLLANTYNNKVPGKVDIIVLLIWQKQKGQWKLLARQAAKLPV